MSLLDEILNLIRYFRNHLKYRFLGKISKKLLYIKKTIINLLEAINNKIHVIYHKLLCAIKDILI